MSMKKSTKTVTKETTANDGDVVHPEENTTPTASHPKLKIGVGALGNNWYGVLWAPEVIRYEPDVQSVASVKLASSDQPSARAEAEALLGPTMTAYLARVATGKPGETPVTGPDWVGLRLKNADSAWRLVLQGFENPSEIARRAKADARISAALVEVLKAAKELDFNPHNGFQADPQDWRSMLEWLDRHREQDVLKARRLNEMDRHQLEKANKAMVAHAQLRQELTKQKQDRDRERAQSMRPGLKEKSQKIPDNEPVGTWISSKAGR